MPDPRTNFSLDNLIYLHLGDGQRLYGRCHDERTLHPLLHGRPDRQTGGDKHPRQQAKPEEALDPVAVGEVGGTVDCGDVAIFSRQASDPGPL